LRCISFLTFKLLYVSGHTEKLRKMSAGGIACDPNAIRIDVIRGCVAFQPADGSFDIINGGRELVLGREAVSNRHGDITARGEFYEKWIIRIAIACSESAAMDADNAGKRGVYLARPSHIELKMLIVRVRELDPFFEENIIGNF